MFTCLVSQLRALTSRAGARRRARRAALAEADRRSHDELVRVLYSLRDAQRALSDASVVSI